MEELLTELESAPALAVRSPDGVAAPDSSARLEGIGARLDAALERMKDVEADLEDLVVAPQRQRTAR